MEAVPFNISKIGKYVPKRKFRDREPPANRFGLMAHSLLAIFNRG